MSKQLISNYTFSTSAKTITLTDFTTIRLDRLRLITDATTNKILYNFADSSVTTATVATNVITLAALQGGEANGDKLQIDYDTVAGDPSYSTNGDVVAGDAGFNGVAVASATKTYTFTTSTAGVQTLGPWNCEGFSWVEVVYTSVGTGLALTGGQFSTASGGAYVTSAEWFNSSAVGTAGALGVTNSTIYGSSIRGNYFQIAVSALTSGTFTGTVTLRATPPPVAYLGVNASQTGNWTAGSNSATGSAFPANAFGQGVKALTASPAAAITGNLVAVMGNTMGMPVIAQSLLNSPIAVSASITVVKNAPGYLSGILVTSAGTSTAMTFYDNASAASGTIIGIVPATATAGTFWPFNMPALAGITASGSATNPAVTVAYA